MFLRKQKTSSGRVLLSIARSYRVSGDKSPRYEIVEKLGYLDEPEDNPPMPIIFIYQIPPNSS
ncbi:MAG: hypothetical protein LBK46_03125 [Oscillospiraceae bacterium]|jgi:hypothetical protein|nr:hypothetical protein [Oscillospiraceae bacterium]